MSATYKIIINSISTIDINGMSDVVKQVSFDVQGSQEGEHFNLPQTVELQNPDSTSFKPFSELTEADVIPWVEVNFSQMDSVKAHIQYVLNQQIAKSSLKVKPLPWQPAPTALPTTASTEV